MDWQQLVINTNSEAAEVFGEFLEGQGAMAVTYSDNEDSPVYEPQPGDLTLWPDTRVTGLFDAEVDLNPIISKLTSLDAYTDSSTHFTETLEDKEWTKVCMEDFHPIGFGNRLWICPSWQEPPEPNAVNIMLDPGLAFGTGTHPTTAMCLEWLDGQNLKGQSITDYGCGSGILAIAALKLGAKHAFAVDIDPQAIIATNANAEKNNVESRLSTNLSEEHDKTPTNVVVANILSGPLKTLYPILSSLCLKGGTIVLSGILSEQTKEIIKTYSPVFKDFSIAERGEWARIIARKK